MAAYSAGDGMDPYENLKKRVVSQIYGDPPAVQESRDVNTSPDFAPSGPVLTGAPKAPMTVGGNTQLPGTGTAPPDTPPVVTPLPPKPPRTVGGEPQPSYPDPIPLGNPADTPPVVTRLPNEQKTPLPPLPPQIPQTTSYASAAPESAFTLPNEQRTPLPKATTSDEPTTSSAQADVTPQNVNAVNGFYRTYLGRDPEAGDAERWLRGEYGWGTDLATIENAIRNSDEAQRYRASHGGGSGGAGTGDPVYDAVFQNYQSLGATPGGPGSGPTDIAYFIKRINDTGGLTEANKAYWFGPNGRIAKELRGEVPPEGRSGGGGGGGVAPPPPSSTPTGTGPTPPPANTAFQEEIRKQIMERLKAAGMPVDENAAGISDAVAAARDEATRAGEQERTALAERLYAQGGGALNSNALTQQIQQSGERTAMNVGGVRAQAIMQEYARKQNELDQLLSMATASGDAEAARNIQLYMAELQAQLQREGISADLAKYAAYLNSQTALAGLNG